MKAKTLEDKIEMVLYDLLSQGGGNGATLTKYATRLARLSRRHLLVRPAPKDVTTVKAPRKPK